MGIDGILYAGPIADFMAVAVSAVLLVKEVKSMRKLIREARGALADSSGIAQPADEAKLLWQYQPALHWHRRGFPTLKHIQARR